MFKIHCFQHVEYEDLGCIADWCKANGHAVSYTRFYQGDKIPVIDPFDWLIIMGGPMGIYDETNYPWLADEKKAITEAIYLNKTVIGICLGAQLIADALGVKVIKNNYKEIGWFNIHLTDQGLTEPLLRTFQNTIKVFHWHGDTFELPNGAIPLAYSEGCANQAFLFNKKVLALQFHFEVTRHSLKSMVENGIDEIHEDKYIQSASEILSIDHQIEVNNLLMFSILNSLSYHVR